MIAAAWGHPYIVRRLLEAGARDDLKDIVRRGGEGWVEGGAEVGVTEGRRREGWAAVLKGVWERGWGPEGGREGVEVVDLFLRLVAL